MHSIAIYSKTPINEIIKNFLDIDIKNTQMKQAGGDAWLHVFKHNNERYAVLQLDYISDSKDGEYFIKEVGEEFIKWVYPIGIKNDAFWVEDTDGWCYALAKIK